MYGTFEPPRRVLTEDQFALKVNGKVLRPEETDALRRFYGLPCSSKPAIMERELVAGAEQKLRGKALLA